MIGSDKLDISVENLWDCWRKYKKGKRKTIDYLQFESELEGNLLRLADDLKSGRYRHGGYFTFMVADNKKRLISVASVRDRLVHRLLYEYLVNIFNRRFDDDVWSCRRNKGLVAAVHRCQSLAKKYRRGYFWRADIKKFFASVDKNVLLETCGTKVHDDRAMTLIREIVCSYSTGLSIGNLTSQILANVYLNEFDRFVRHTLKPQAYMRYGDDFIIFDINLDLLVLKQKLAIIFLSDMLKLKINSRNNYLGKISNGIRYLGCVIYPDRLELNRRNKKRVFRRLNGKNLGSYHGLLKKFGNKELRDRLVWEMMEHT